MASFSNLDVTLLVLRLAGFGAICVVVTIRRGEACDQALFQYPIRARVACHAWRLMQHRKILCG